MSTHDIQSIIATANKLLGDDKEKKKALAAFLLPKHEPLTASIRLNEWLRGDRTPTDFGVMTRLSQWVESKGTLSSKKQKPKTKTTK